MRHLSVLLGTLAALLVLPGCSALTDFSPDNREDGGGTNNQNGNENQNQNSNGNQNNNNVSPFCGNGTLDSGEDCDDGSNTSYLDGCHECRHSPAPVASSSTTTVRYAAVAMSPDGYAAVVWTEQDSSGISHRVRYLVIDPTGAIGTLNTVTSDDVNPAQPPAVSWYSQDGFVILIATDTQPWHRVYTYSQYGTAYRNEGAYNPGPVSDLGELDLACWPSTGCTGAWSADGDDDGRGVFAFFTDEYGEPSGQVVTVSDGFDGDQGVPSVARWQSGDSVVVFRSRYNHVYGRRYTSAGAELDGSGFDVYSLANDSTSRLSVASAASGEFVVTYGKSWAAGEWDVFARWFDATGQPDGGELHLSTIGTANNWLDSPRSVAVIGEDDLFAIWNYDFTGEVGYLLGRSYDKGSAEVNAEAIDSVTTDGFSPLSMACAANQPVCMAVWVRIPEGVDKDPTVFGMRMEPDTTPLPLVQE